MLRWVLLAWCNLMVISDESMNFNDPKEFDYSQVLDDLKEILIGSMDFHNPKVYGDTSISDGLVNKAIIGVKNKIAGFGRCDSLHLHRLKINTVHYRLRWSLGRFLSQKLFISQNLFFSEKGYICQIK